MRRTYHHDDPLVAQAELEVLARELDRSHPGAAASLRQGLAETLTVVRLGVPPTLARTLRSTNSIESMIAICRDHAANVSTGRTARWCCAGWPPGWAKRPSDVASAPRRPDRPLPARVRLEAERAELVHADDYLQVAV
jgi:hypothetical protein